MKPRICVLINNYSEIGSLDIIESYLPQDKFSVTLACDFPTDYKNYLIIAPLNYRKIIKEAETTENIVIFHASDLPDGRGWAPLYYALSEAKEHYVVTGIKASKNIDAGEIIVRASFEILSNYTASFLRVVDQHIFFLLIAKLLAVWPDGDFPSVAQSGIGSYKKRRSPADNEINTSLPFVDLISHLRAVETNHPAFFFHDGEKYLVSIQPEKTPRFPNKVSIRYEAIKKNEIWEGWS